MSANPFIVSAIVFAFVFGGALLGMLLSRVLPKHHLSDESRNLMNLGVGLIGTMAVLVLGLLTASAKDFFDTKNNELTEMSAKTVMVDRLLAHYGPETKEIRQMLAQAVHTTLRLVWSETGSNPDALAPSTTKAEIIFDKVQELVPKSSLQSSLQTQAVNLLIDIGETRWLMFEQGVGSISIPFLVVMVFWLMIIFVSFGLFIPSTGTVTATLFFWSLSVSSAIFLILEMYRPFEGLIRISSAPLRAALMHLGQ